MSFDFSSYIQDRFPNIPLTSSFSVEFLAGGFTNHTARVSFELPVALPFSVASGFGSALSPPKSIKSAVLKHAEPYLVANPTQKLPITRQLVEHRALCILSGEDREFSKFSEKVRSGIAFKRGVVRLPKLLWHDEENKVLWIEDLGQMKTLSEVLLDEKGNRSKDLRKPAEELGAFVAEMHQLTTNPPSELLQYLTSLSHNDGVAELLVAVTQEVFRTRGVDGNEATGLLRRVKESFGVRDVEGVCLGMVDFWTDNVLLEHTAQGELLKCGLVDWEYFGPSSAPSEMGMFLAHLQLHILNSTATNATKMTIQSFIIAMYEAYATTNGTEWRPSHNFVRRFLLSHGRELVNDVHFYTTSLDESSKRRLLNAGLRSLRAAGGSVEEIDLSILRASICTEADLNGLEAEGIRWIWDALLALRFDST
ncbi:kinase-like domain-containing protein [Cristinia sonorae]|uniref:Kinase-like domain-containing protein n=1 Tax=Cristinia sonorae TaxID=1940300 RepID=A0A8K0UP79_9AGAR|nr:kinase-like domain-containing protein [Cristinia sonorae]